METTKGDENMETTAMRIQKRRLELGMTQDELAKKVGYKDRSSISYIEDGKKNLKQSTIVKLAEALKTTPSYLMDGYDMETIYQQIQIMDEFDRMVLINRLNKDFNHKRSMLEILTQEHDAYVTVDQVADIIQKALDNADKKELKSDNRFGKVKTIPEQT